MWSNDIILYYCHCDGDNPEGNLDLSSSLQLYLHLREIPAPGWAKNREEEDIRKGMVAKNEEELEVKNEVKKDEAKGDDDQEGDVEKDDRERDDKEEDEVNESDKEDEVNEDDKEDEGDKEYEMKKEDVKGGCVGEDDVTMRSDKGEKMGEEAFPCSSWGSKLPHATPKSSKPTLT